MIIIPRPHFYLSVGQPARNKFLRACKRQKYIKHTVFIRLTAWALVKFLDLKSGRFFEAGCLLNFHHSQQVQYVYFATKQCMVITKSEDVTKQGFCKIL